MIVGCSCETGEELEAPQFWAGKHPTILSLEEVRIRAEQQPETHRGTEPGRLPTCWLLSANRRSWLIVSSASTASMMPALNAAVHTQLRV